MNTTFHPSNERGAAEHGWLHSHHSFSFASFYDPNKMGFGLLRVLNDDVVEPGQGFGTHPHQDMEIVSIPLKGELEHKDSEGNHGVIRPGEVQLMSAGTGVLHSEYNASKLESVNFLQVWIMPKELRIKPRYDQQMFDADGRKDQWQTVVSPMTNDDPGVKINQDAWFRRTDLSKEMSLRHELATGNHGAYLFVLSGEIEVNGQTLATKDALGVSDAAEIEVHATSDASVLMIEVPMA